MTETTTTTVTPVAFLEEHIYPDGYGRREFDKPFWIARCDDPSHGPIALNSGHHYTVEVKHHAERLIAEHDQREHHCATCGDASHNTAEHVGPLDLIPNDLEDATE